MYRILKEFNVKYKANTLAEFTEETAEKIMASGAYIELIEEPTKGEQPSVANPEINNPQGENPEGEKTQGNDDTEGNDGDLIEETNPQGENPEGIVNKVISSKKNNK